MMNKTKYFYYVVISDSDKTTFCSFVDAKIFASLEETKGKICSIFRCTVYSNITKSTWVPLYATVKK